MFFFVGLLLVNAMSASSVCLELRSVQFSYTCQLFIRYSNSEGHFNERNESFQKLTDGTCPGSAPGWCSVVAAVNTNRDEGIFLNTGSFIIPVAKYWLITPTFRFLESFCAFCQLTRYSPFDAFQVSKWSFLSHSTIQLTKYLKKSGNICNFGKCSKLLNLHFRLATFVCVNIN